jgi:hypothetical protein
VHIFNLGLLRQQVSVRDGYSSEAMSTETVESLGGILEIFIGARLQFSAKSARWRVRGVYTFRKDSFDHLHDETSYLDLQRHVRPGRQLPASMTENRSRGVCTFRGIVRFDQFPSHPSSFDLQRQDRPRRQFPACMTQSHFRYG